MTKFLLAVHVLAAIVAIGPVTVAASMFPPTVRRALADPGDRQAVAWVRLLHRICRVYAVIGLTVPVFGFATASSMGVLGDTWLIVSIALTALAAVALGALVLPRQEALLAGIEAITETGAAEATGEAGRTEGSGATGPAGKTAAAPPDRRATARLAMVTGIFNLLWATVTVLMIIRPGSTTGA
ncbi:protease [Streptomyces lushanensis]|uniref:protease n=1 Tax=Streptomyces lushanensis TaxID=1434255 RepID=UPI000834B4BF|nr:protease [Streptomyces lushanensis]